MADFSAIGMQFVQHYYTVFDTARAVSITPIHFRIFVSSFFISFFFNALFFD